VHDAIRGILEDATARQLRREQSRDKSAERRLKAKEKAIAEAKALEAANVSDTDGVTTSSSDSTASVFAGNQSKEKKKHLLKPWKLSNTGPSARYLDETVELSFEMNLDPRKPNQSIRSTILLPNGSGKKSARVVAFVTDDDAETVQAALDAGATAAGFRDLVDKILGQGIIDFDRAVAHPDVMATLKKSGAARVLGPKGLMPNVKLGTVTEDVVGAVREQTLGPVEYRTDKQGAIHAAVGKVSFGYEGILENVRSFVEEVYEMKPEGAKGKRIYVEKVTISTTQGKGITVSMDTIDPSSPRFFLEAKKLEAA